MIFISIGAIAIRDNSGLEPGSKSKQSRMQQPAHECLIAGGGAREKILPDADQQFKSWGRMILKILQFSSLY